MSTPIPGFMAYAAQVAGVSDREQTSTILYKGRPVAPIIGSWMNGNPQLAQLGENHPGYRGGMFIANDNLQGVTSIPGWMPFTFYNRENKAIPGLASANFYAILIRERMRWLTKDRNDKRPPRSKYAEGYNSNSHLLMILPGLDFPVVLAGHGQAFSEAIEQVMKDRETAIGGALATIEQQLRAAGTNNPDAPLFDMLRCAFTTHVTAGALIMKTSKADAQKSSPVTPIRAVFPEPVTQDHLTQMFVGGDMIEVVKDLFVNSAEWEKEWAYTDAPEPLGAPIPGGYVPPTPAHIAPAPAQQPYVPPAPPVQPQFTPPPTAVPAAAPANLAEIAAPAYGGVTPPVAGQYATPAPPQEAQFAPPPQHPQFAPPPTAPQPAAPQFAAPPTAAAPAAPSGQTWAQAPPLNLPPAQGSPVVNAQGQKVDANGNIIPF